MATHVKVLAVISLALGSAGILGALFVSLLFGVLASVVGASADPDAGVGVAVLGLTGTALAAYLLVTSAVAIACGWGLLKRRRWARILGIVFGAILLIMFPLGTVLGIYALWVLFSKDTEALFAAA
jgi:hypothetical protein